MAFFTMIAPLITLTYPIDKVNDGRAQAFSMWIKEYVFNALIQVVHLIVYFTLVESAMELVNSFPLYGIIAIGFMTQAEKIIRSMFGFNNAETVGTMGAAAAGGLITSAMNKLKSLSSGIKGGKTGGNSSSGGGSTSNNVRTVTKNPLGSSQGGTGGGSGSENSSAQGARTASSNSSEAVGVNDTAKRRIKGAAKLGNKYIFKNLDKVGGAALGVLAGGTGAMIGFAAGVAQGDVGAAFTGAVAGGAALGTVGNRLGKGVANLPENIGKGVKTGWNNVKNTYREGAYGEEAAQAIRFDEEFRNGSTYKALQSNENFSEESVQAMLNEGITDKKEMTAILDSGLNVNEAIEYSKLAKKCPDAIYYNDNMLRTFWRRTMGVEEKDAEKIRDVLGQFK